MPKYLTVRRSKIAPGFAALALIWAASGMAAAAMEEVVVHASGGMGQSAHQAQLKRQIAAYAQDVHTELKDGIRRDLARATAPRIRVARSAATHRG